MIGNSSAVSLAKLAIDAALSSRWNKALEYNREINKLEPDNIECLNRLAKAYLELGKYQQSKKTYQEVLKRDPYNMIAQKNIKKISAFKKNGDPPKLDTDRPVTLLPSLFLEEPGITKVINLIKVAEPQKLLTLSAGVIVNLVTKNRGITVTQNDHYIGVLPDDTAHHLMKLIHGGNKYQAIVKSVKQNGVSLLVREIFRSKKFKNQASFLDEAKILTYSSENISLGSDNTDEIIDHENPDEPVI